jgi:hypothetical protein
MFSILLRRNNPFTTTSTKSSMKLFCFSYDFLYVVATIGKCGYGSWSYHFLNLGTLFFISIFLT